MNCCCCCCCFRQCHYCCCCCCCYYPNHCLPRPLRRLLHLLAVEAWAARRRDPFRCDPREQIELAASFDLQRGEARGPYLRRLPPQRPIGNSIHPPWVSRICWVQHYWVTNCILFQLHSCMHHCPPRRPKVWKTTTRLVSGKRMHDGCSCCFWRVFPGPLCSCCWCCCVCLVSGPWIGSSNSFWAGFVAETGSFSFRDAASFVEVVAVLHLVALGCPLRDAVAAISFWFCESFLPVLSDDSKLY
mmetsp:Transcript_10559/g.23402  ORF Transcript_10559/g.23402 Transcript_10559/m.23402 type:complete len:244 (+) Transcript_10559:2126-2857(+)